MSVRGIVGHASATRRVDRAMVRRLWRDLAQFGALTSPEDGGDRRLEDSPAQPPPAVALADADTDTDTLTFASMRGTALLTAAIWPLMHSA